MKFCSYCTLNEVFFTPFITPPDGDSQKVGSNIMNISLEKERKKRGMVENELGKANKVNVWVKWRMVTSLEGQMRFLTHFI